MWTCVYLSGGVKINVFLNSYVSRSPERRTAQNALHVMLLSYYIGMCVFHEHQRDICRRLAYSHATFAVAARTRKVSRRPCTCPTTGNILILHKPLLPSRIWWRPYNDAFSHKLARNHAAASNEIIKLLVKFARLGLINVTLCSFEGQPGTKGISGNRGFTRTMSAD